MRILFAQTLTQHLQDAGIYKDDYNHIADRVYNVLNKIEKDLTLNDCLQLPNGTTLQVTYKV